MKISIQEDENQPEIEIVIRCSKTDEQVCRLLSSISSLDKRLAGVRDGKTYVIEPDNVLYFDSVDKKTFMYTEGEVYEIQSRLYELEERLPHSFFRASKSSIINICKIKSILPDFGGRLEVTLTSGEKLAVSRQYARDLKLKLEI